MILVSSHLRSTQQNNYVRVAYAWLHGRMWIDWPGRWMDAVQYNGHYYGVDGPVPALFMLPSVAIWGNAANQTMVAIVFAAVATGLAWVLAERLGVTDLSTKVFLALFFVAGTDVWWCAELGDVWFLAHLCAVAFILGALVELCGKSRGWLVGLVRRARVRRALPRGRGVAAVRLGACGPARSTAPCRRARSASRGCARSASCSRAGRSRSSATTS